MESMQLPVEDNFAVFAFVEVFFVGGSMIGITKK
jgi:hypothetical protein